MATTYEAKSYKGVPAVSANTFPGVVRRAVSIDLEELTGDASYAFVINDIVKVFKLPPLAKILYGRLVSGDVALDDHATPTLDLDVIVTDGTTTKTLVNGGTAINQADVTAVTDLDADNAYLYVTTDDDFYVAVKAIAAAAGDAAADATFIVDVEYTGILEPGETPASGFDDLTP